MSTPVEFDVFGCPLDGVNLIEASAGTGKTWNICGLYLRLVLERRLDVQHILVVTFTNAATAELRERIRARVVEALGYLRDGGVVAPSGDPFVQRLVAAAEQRTGESRDELARRLERSVAFFDEAAIFTIHGFCQRALADAPFSAGMPFALNAVADDGEMLLEAVHDFWRRHVAGEACPAALAAWLRQKKDSPETLAALLKWSLEKPLAKCRWPAGLDAPGAGIDTAALTTAYDAAASIWAARRAEIADTVMAARPTLWANVYKIESIEQALAEWDAWLRGGNPLAGLPDKHKLAHFTSGLLRIRTKGSAVPPSHPFFDAADALLAARAADEGALGLARLRLIRDLIATAGPELRRRKRERRVVSFADMLHNLHAALTGGAQPELARTLRQRFPVALVDEFQDTDPLQFAIFETIYGVDGVPAFFVGDPKQAIYSFRHADLHTYLRARQRTSAIRTLAHNQRSTPGLIAALNGLFGANPAAFMLPGLDYHEAKVGERERKPFADASLARADLQAWLLPGSPEGTPIAKSEATLAAASATAAEIARLVVEGRNRRTMIGARGLAPGDVAVLVRTHRQGSQIKRELARLGIASVELSQASVFQTPDAEEVERVLIAVNQPSRETLLRGALATEMLGLDAAAIAAISTDETKLMDWLARFADYRDVWLRQGVGVMYRRLLAREGVSARMLYRDDGERRLTNLLHLGEQIHQAAATHESPDALLRWLATKRRDGTADDAAQLRLESDRNLVKIVTIHKAKGLEFPIVFCPFLWDGRIHGRTPVAGACVYHDDAGDVVVDFRTGEEIGKAERQEIESAIRLESAAEDLRLIYVALTRAVYRCYVVAGIYATSSFGRPSVAESTKSLLNWLVAGSASSPKRWLAAKKHGGDEVPPAAITAAWQALALRLAPHVRAEPLPDVPGAPVVLDAPPPESLTALTAPPIAPAWRIASYSSLAGNAQSESAATDHDAHVAAVTRRIGAPPPDVAPDDILRFPRGADAGECLHAIFERIDFGEPAGWSDAIAHGLAAHPQFVAGARPGAERPLLTSMVTRMLANVTSTKLPDGIVLASISPARRLTELEFGLPAPRVSSHALNATLADLGYDVPRLAFRDLEGYLKGFVDLVFEHAGRYYVLDWKSNHLGYSPADYGPAGMQAAMAEHGYHLQYLLYALAVDRYLRHRLPGYRRDTHFGGVLYLFVRGVRPEWAGADGVPAGVFHHRPTAATLSRLDALFANEPARALR